MVRSFVGILLRVWLAASCLFAGTMIQARAGSTAALVPAYFYPSGAGLAAWNRLADDAASIPVEAILNPASGPGTTRDPNYVTVVDNIRSAGGRVLGYVDTNYGKRTLVDVKNDIIKYTSFYHVDGFFLDQMANTPERVSHYEAVYRFIKQSNADLRVVSNPGTPYFPEAYINTADSLVIIEGTGAGYAGYKPFVPSPWIARYPPIRFANIVHGVATSADMQEAIIKARETNAGSIFVTDDKMPNPYRGLPSYWKEEVAAIRSQSAPPAEVTTIPAQAMPQAEVTTSALAVGVPFFSIGSPAIELCAPVLSFAPRRRLGIWIANKPLRGHFGCGVEGLDRSLRRVPAGLVP